MITVSTKVEISRATAKLNKLALLNAEGLRQEVDPVAQRITTIFRQATPERSGTLRKGWLFEEVSGDGRLTVRIRNTAPNAKRLLGYLKRGTEAHPIFPRFKKALSFQAGEGPLQRAYVHHPGTKPDAKLNDADGAIKREIDTLKTRLLLKLSGRN